MTVPVGTGDGGDRSADGPADVAPRLPLRALLGCLAAAGVVLAVQELLLPAATLWAGPGLFAAATVGVGALIWRHSRQLDATAAATWRGFSVIAALLALGQALRAVTGAGVNPSATGPADLALAATGPVAVLVCVRLVRSTGGRVRARSVLDTATALLALGLLVRQLVHTTLGAAPAADPLLTVGYPVVAAVLCAVGLATFAGVSAPRRRAAAWVLGCFGSLAVAMAAGSLAVARPVPALDVVTSTAYLSVLGTAVLALCADPGPRARATEPTAAVPLAGVLVSYCLSFGVLLLCLGEWVSGRPVAPREALGLTALILLTFLRTLVWASEGARLTRQVLRTEAYFRGLVDGAADITIVLDARERITWASGADRPGAWAARELEGRRLLEFVHEDDRPELLRALDPRAAGDGRPVPVFRLRTREGGWRRFETVRSAPAAGPGRPVPGGEGLVLQLRDSAGEDTAARELHRMAYTDFLTGLPNRARLMEELDAAGPRARAGDPACLLLLDLDGFKPVNDVAGHDAGDELLVRVADRLRRTVRDGDLVSRLGGDEFAVLARAGTAEATALAERIVVDLRELRTTVPTGGTAAGLVLDVSASVGVTELDPDDEVTATIRRADLALRTAKAAGKNRVCRHSDAADSATGRRARLVRDLPAAIEEGRLRVVYQPVVGLAERRVLGLEALVRWNHPVLGPVPPEEFVALAEDDGTIVPLQRFVLRAATVELARLVASGHDLKVSVNISARHVQAGCLVPDVATALDAAGLPPQRLILELTESVLLDREDRLTSDLATLGGMGCVISLDDFGKGYSSLAYLARLPVDILKMDREFVAGIEDDPRGAALVRSIVALGRTLGMDVVAEGVETPGQLALLADMDCRFLQGWLLGRPVPGTDIGAVIDAFDAAVLDVVPRPRAPVSIG